MKESKAKDKIIDAYLNYILLKENGEASISDFCTIMKISRSTFYSNYDGLWQIKEKAIDRYRKKYQAFFSSVSQEKHDFDSFFPLFLDFVKENETYYKAMFITQTFDDSDPLFLQFKKDSYKLMDEKNIESDDREYVFQFYVFGLIHTITKWIQDGYRKSKAEITEIVKKCLFKQ